MFQCETCGSSFDLPQAVLEKYPGWTPKQCMSCRNGGSVSKAKPATSAKRPASISRSRDLTVAEVLATFNDGPTTGVFTDGASSGNPGPGGWGAVMVRDGQVVRQEFGSEDPTTNNRMELMAMISGLKMVEPDQAIDIYTDSKLVVDTLNSWARSWEARGWTRKTGPIKNLELVQEAYRLKTERRLISVKWIAAHSGYRWNEYADSLATAYRRDTL